MIKFSILIPTYNRQSLVQQAVESILNQSYQNFEILLIDNGSYPPVDHAQYSDPRIRLFRNEKNIGPTEAIEGVLDKIGGTHFLFLADDDALVPNALEIVKKTLISNPDIEYLSTGFIHYDHVEKYVPEDNESIIQFSGILESYDAWEAMLFYFNGYWGIGEKKRYKGPQASHSSATFLSIDLIKRTRQAQKELFIKSFGDVGYVGALLQTKHMYYLELPLAIVGQSNFSDSMGMQLGKRMRMDPRYQKDLEYTSLNGISFINIGTDTHLRVIYRNKIEGIIDCKLRPEFFFTHLQAVLSDSPWTRQTIKDILEVTPYLLKSVLQIKSVNGLINTCLSAFSLHKPLISIVKRNVSYFIGANISGMTKGEEIFDKSEKLHFSSINDAGKWMGELISNPHS